MSGGLSSRSGTAGAAGSGAHRALLYKSPKYDSHDYSTVGSVGYSALESLWAPLASNDHSKVCCL